MIKPFLFFVPRYPVFHSSLTFPYQAFVQTLVKPDTLNCDQY